MRQLLRAYRVACHYSDTEDETDASLQITSSTVFNRVLLFVLKEARCPAQAVRTSLWRAPARLTRVFRQA